MPLPPELPDGRNAANKAKDAGAAGVQSEKEKEPKQWISFADYIPNEPCYGAPKKESAYEKHTREQKEQQKKIDEEGARLGRHNEREKWREIDRLAKEEKDRQDREKEAYRVEYMARESAAVADRRQTNDFFNGGRRAARKSMEISALLDSLHGLVSRAGKKVRE